MSYRRTHSRAAAWLAYCDEHRTEIDSVGLPMQVFATEWRFREYATTGKIEGSGLKLPTPAELSEAGLQRLHRFVTGYFDMDAALFDALETARLRPSG